MLFKKKQQKKGGPWPFPKSAPGKTTILKSGNIIKIAASRFNHMPGPSRSIQNGNEGRPWQIKHHGDFN